MIAGFITASGLLIATSQVKHILGIQASGHSLIELLVSLVSHLGEVNLPTLAIGLSVIGFLFWVRSGLNPLLQRIGIPPGLAGVLTKT